ncbi:MAG: hypothetical protein ACT4O9_07865 [Blastocatellia bacterium]
MSTLTLEDTWEEVQRHGSRLVGHQVRLIVLDGDEKNGSRSNEKMLEALKNIKSKLGTMRPSSGTKTQEYVREARNGGLFDE